MRTILAVTLLLNCAGCCLNTTRPVTVGRVVDPSNGLGLEGAVVTAHELQSGKYLQSTRPPQPGERVWESPKAEACALTDWQGKFSLPGQQFGPIADHSGYWRIRVHRGDAYDATYDYYYEQKASDGCHPTKDIGTVELHIPPENHTPQFDATPTASQPSGPQH
jgi:hypothetical protein